MLISDSHKFAFIHIPKCAGTTVRKSLLKFDTRNNFYWMHNTLEGFGLQGEKTTIDFDKSHLTLNVLKYYYEYGIYFVGLNVQTVHQRSLDHLTNRHKIQKLNE